MYMKYYVYLRRIIKQNLLKLCNQMHLTQHTKIKQDQLSFNNPEDIHDFPMTFYDLYTSKTH